ncbi:MULTISPECIES: PHP domain-containing protein [unclassified Enterococcus]|uniref:PHP domain-containing protein n=1 Tax=unclassified Enterococcus TaxID=2608891 RepID=UPI0015559A05|nr:MULTISPECIES: PHP domain-containing protein [unclassified Enterococcus]MBS7577237.1 hypothetical protein [Enterococcus sp. MMGLQ5-2]MBS7584670.1 hypothetical protein [Enterococcus sp. MMGLQ5-1]NPD12525.1 hypothetical protein [Enterococcus sp. MMGLQ5-1]NPD37071.1 hypothetical protein [Enterococcus sp. MMGLQ5-2]
MEYYDQHLHTYFSYDAQEKFESYLENFDGFVVTTEHFDLANPVTHQDDVPDYAAYQEKIAELNQKYQNRVLKGIEIGYIASEKDRIKAYLRHKDFDLKLLSIHHNGKFDYLDDFVADMDYRQILDEYLKAMNEAINEIPANVLAHFDYGIRLFDLSVDQLKAFEPQLIQIFNNAIQHQLAFEVNAKSTHLYHNLALYDYALDLYLALGGKLISLGSDGHKIEHFRLHFDELLALIKSKGINELATYQHGQLKLVKI